jgi:mRNA interferase RelE/StbE
MATLKIDRAAFRILAKLPANVRGQLLWKALQLAEDSYGLGQNIKRLKGEGSMRLRVGDWRIIYEPIEDGVEVLAIGPRGNVYED